MPMGRQRQVSGFGAKRTGGLDPQHGQKADRRGLGYKGMGAEEIAAFARPDYSKLSTSDLAMHHHDRVSGRFVGQLGAAGFPPFSPDELLALHFEGVSPSGTAAPGRIGYSTLSARNLISIHYVGLALGFANRIHSLGYDNLSAATPKGLFWTGSRPGPRRPARPIAAARRGRTHSTQWRIDMRLVLTIASLVLALSPVAAPGAAAKPAPPAHPIEVMIVGLFHMSGSAHDLHNEVTPDVLQPRQQAQLIAITDSLARFRPTAVAVEWDAPFVAEWYPKYLSNEMKPSRNEVVQLGFRLGKKVGKPVYGIDADGDFLWQPFQTYAEAHGDQQLLADEDAVIVRDVANAQRLIDTSGIAPALRYLNDPMRLRSANGWYRNLLRVGEGKDEPAVDLLTGWYRRNFQICANLIRTAKPGDRIVVFFGNGHAFLLRQCVAETPGMKLVEANDYLPR
jgi:hypothetical protein